jgi:hypothetical protein
VGSFQKLASSSADARYIGAVDHDRFVRAELLQQERDGERAIMSGVAVLAIFVTPALGALLAALERGQLPEARVVER